MLRSMLFISTAISLACVPNMVSAQDVAKASQTVDIRQAADASVATEEKEPIAKGWYADGDGLSVHHSGITLPTDFGIVQYDSSQEAKSATDGMDNILQYTHENTGIYTSIYIYRPALADAEMNAVLTRAAINSRFKLRENGQKVQLNSLGGIENGAITMIYPSTDSNFATAAAFAKVGEWIVKYRVTGPQSESDEVAKILETIVTGTKVAEPAKIANLSLNAPGQCTVGLKGKAQLSKEGRRDKALDGIGGTLGNLLIAAAQVDKSGLNLAPIKTTFSQWCIAGSYTIDQSTFYIYRSEDKEGSQIIAPFGDTGKAFVTLPDAEKQELRRFAVYEIGKITLFGALKGDLSAKQYKEILTGKSNLLKNSQKTTVKFEADGSNAIQISI